MEIKDYLHLYIGQQVLCSGFEFIGQPEPNVIAIIDSVSKECVTLVTDSGRSVNDYWYDNPEFKMQPILRKLSGMTEEECDKYGIAYLNGEYTKDCFEADATYGTTFKVYGIKSLSERVIQMCKDGWDLFDLIPAGLAIDKTPFKN